jgi:tRNA(fMet)-specific endonuclease VapC
MSRPVILDTSILIASGRGQLKLTNVIGDDDPAVAAITAMELLVGVERSAGEQRDKRALQTEDICATLPIEAYTLKVARLHALLHHHVGRIGLPRGPFDLIIAATAGATGRTLLTLDAKAGFDKLPGVTAEVVKLS